MTVRFTKEAQQHIAEIYSYIYQRNSTAAIAVLARIRATTNLLEDFPLLGHRGSVSGTYELIVKGLSYIIVYEMNKRKKQVVILGVFHGARDSRDTAT